MSKSPKILLLDIETAPHLGYSFEIYEATMMHVVQPSYILCFSVKWLGRNKIHTHAIWDFKQYKKNKADDGPLLKRLSEYLDRADVVIAHNGDNFDLKVIMYRMLVNGIREPSPFQTVDTLKALKRRYKFPSNRLNYVAPILGIGSKLPTQGKDTWLGCMDGKKKDQRMMERYNAHDVSPLLEGVYLKLRPSILNHPNLSLFTGRTDEVCPTCGSDDVKREGTKVRRTRLVQQFSCKGCGHWFSRGLANGGIRSRI